MIHMGLDVGSTTVKLVALSEDLEILYSTYQRHFSDVKKTVQEVLSACYDAFKYEKITINVTGSGGLSVHELLDIDFIQEVVAGTVSIQQLLPETDVAIELGGEDSKITYLKGSLEQRMNSICAGGTGAFIDQMASLLKTDASGLNELAKTHSKIYPIASRCGVFAKTDVQALLNQGATKADIAASVFQSVVNQTISNLACGRPIRGKVAFLGGPLHFLPELKQRFIETLNLTEEEILSPSNGQIFVALGAAISSRESAPISYLSLYERLGKAKPKIHQENGILEPLFANEEELEEFRKRHDGNDLKRRNIEDYKGPIYLGIDAGSTTTKVVALSDQEEVLFEAYGSNNGNPLDMVRERILELYEKMGADSYVASSGITGYGEDFIKAAFHIDHGEVETIAHFRAARFFEPEVDFILDIGGQDMKAMQVNGDVIESILLNEACSSGCGSFLETFAKSVQHSVQDFSQVALSSEEPVDLGSRCTVFMNSKVKQAQKEGAEVSDISAGLAYSVIKNAIQKVIKVRDPKTLGNHIVVQGGTFYSDAVLRAFEKITGREVTRPKMSGTMGAIGMALLSKERAHGESTLITQEEMESFTYETKTAHCGQCTNQCQLTINFFNGNERFITGNRCERGAGIVKNEEEMLPNLYKYKLERLFDYDSLEEDQAKRGVIGLPRVLNMYENYPFWHTFFTQLGYRVVLSDPSSRKIYEKGIESITSETACYPAKIVHGHIENLIEKNVPTIFYPSIFYEDQQFENANNTLNCPVVTGYSEVIKNNVENLELHNVNFMNPFLSFDNHKKMASRLEEIFPSIPMGDIKKAVKRAYEEQERYREDVRQEGKRVMKWLEETDSIGIVLAGRPYHIDGEINHGISELITSLGMAVLSEDSIVEKENIDGKLRVLDQWNYHSRLYRAAKLVAESEHLEMVQLNSFGCGIDAVTTDQVNEILNANHKIYTVLKIDEVNNLGAVRIRLRSLMEAVQNRTIDKEAETIYNDPVLFTEEMRKTHTILIPQMAPTHFAILEPVLRQEGLNVEVLPNLSSHVVDEGLRYVNNDACYPSIFVVGQFMDAVKSGRYDTDNLTLLMAQTGGACRASNYVGFIRRALKDAGYGHIPVLGASFQGIEKHPGFSFGKRQLLRLGKKAVQSLLYGDLIMRLSNATRPYETIKGSVKILEDRWISIASDEKLTYSKSEFASNVKSMIQEFSELEIIEEVRPKVGIVGEILVKYLPEANNHVQQLLEEEGAEVVIPDLTDFMLYSFKNSEIKRSRYGTSYKAEFISNMMTKYVESYRGIIMRELEGTRYDTPLPIEQLMAYAEEFVDLGNQYGEGWLLTAEMVELIHSGAGNIVCVQPFGCLPNHITGKGVIKAIREKYPMANIVPIDFDASASEVNQFNRIKLMLSQANKNKYENDNLAKGLRERKCVEKHG
ncbi:acyl-CoA dehydratase activase-related protein [Peptoniphilus sp. KCTC 25270]|uniref:acyl-CoA dehydratase activase-related protein n=1 Tax=Peptoniphilus sp. KCTC 25270 TaxID=2897414 RepID=UPI001E2A5BAD|nr:acyl-CoA dehydratase activase-related protein [Peptoniphilus sp. KCTC 25270]MCD1147319.1 acyl-CoA dehydratase activase-related protein [Peptoniphilus sp. KCTC 25270]